MVFRLLKAALLKTLFALAFLLPFHLAYAYVDPPFELPSKGELSVLRTAVIKTNRGDMTFELYPEEAPWHVANFKYLADKGFYKGLHFTIFKPNYIIQGGAPDDGKSGPGYSLPPEAGTRPHQRGSLGMARMEDIVNVERRSNGSQFHILLNDASHMDGKYTIFGTLIRGIGY